MSLAASSNEKAQASGAQVGGHAAGSFPENRAIAGKLEEYASLLDQQQANPFRVKAYERAAQVIAGLEQPVANILAAEGQEGLTALPGIAFALVLSWQRHILPSGAGNRQKSGYALSRRQRGALDTIRRFLDETPLPPEYFPHRNVSSDVLGAITFRGENRAARMWRPLQWNAVAVKGRKIKVGLDKPAQHRLSTPLPSVGQPDEDA